MVIALLVRIWWIAKNTAGVENEGAEYSRIADSIRAGAGYTGLQGMTQLLFPPLYPFLILAFHVFGTGTVMAGRLVSLVAGSAMVIPVYSISRRSYGIRVALVAALLVAVHPVLIAFSAAVYSETTYLTLQLTGVAFGLDALQRRSVRRAMVAGLAFGLAALVRPEALVVLAMLALGAVISLVLTHEPARRWALITTAALATAALVFVPYSIWTSGHAGRLVISGKATVTSVINDRMASGQSYEQATRGVSANGTPVGALLVPNELIGGRQGPLPPVIQPLQLVKSELVGWRDVARQYAGGGPWGGFLLVATVFAGLAVGVNRKSSLIRHAPILTLGAANLLVIGSVAWFQFRFALPLLPPLIMIAARGLVLIGDAADVVARRLSLHLPDVAVAGSVIALGVAGFVVTPVIQQGSLCFPTMGCAGSRTALAEAVGKRITTDHPESVMSNSATLAYAAGSRWVPMPWTADSTAAAAYLSSQQPTVVVLDSGAGEPFQSKWLRIGLPDPAYHLWFTQSNGTSQLRVYKMS